VLCISERGGTRHTYIESLLEINPHVLSQCVSACNGEGQQMNLTWHHQAHE